MTNIEIIKSIRFKTGLSLKEISKAVESLNITDEDSIIKHLREQGVLKAQARGDRETSNGGVFSYIHDSKIGVMIEIKCETDFVARGELFRELGQDLCLHIAAYQPKFLSEDQLDISFIESEVEVAREQLLNEGKSAEMIEKILSGKKQKIIKENTFLNQPFIKNQDISVNEYILQFSQSTGEKIEISRFVVYSLNN
jgi:elongation factor Ts